MPGNTTPILHSTICAKCGGEAKVPFKPDGIRPVLCGACFGQKRDNAAGLQIQRRGVFLVVQDDLGRQAQKDLTTGIVRGSPELIAEGERTLWAIAAIATR